MAISIDALLTELRSVGHPVDSLWDLVNTKARYPRAIPVLINWLDSLDPKELAKHSEDVEAAVRALAVPEARGVAGPTLIRLFRLASDSDGTGIRWTIGNSLAAVADDSLNADLIEIVRDKAFGRAREMVVLALAKLKSPKAESVLIELLSDDDVVGHAIVALGKRQSQAAIPSISRLLFHANPWVRKEAKNALKRIR